MTGFYRGGTALLSATIAVLGLALVGRSLAAGAWSGVLVGLLFVAAGAGRLYLLRRR